MLLHKKCFCCDKEFDQYNNFGIYVCPECGSDEVEEIYTMYCLDCQAKFEANMNDECPECGSFETEEDD